MHMALSPSGLAAGLLALVACHCNARAATPPAPALHLDEASVAQLQQQMANGETTSHALVKLYLDRIAAMDKSGPAINAIIELNPDALKIADELDAERKHGKVRGPLHGIPILIKDNIDTADRTHTSAGSLALADSIATHDATIATKLREAGAVILGKTNLSEWANFRSTHATSGWSGRGGQTRNPPMRWIAIPADQVQARARALRQILRRWALARKPTDRSFARPRQTVWLASNRRSGWSAAPASFRSRTVRILPDRWRAAWRMQRHC